MGLRWKSHLGDTGKGTDRGRAEEGSLTKEPSCCLHTNLKLIMSGGAGWGNVLAGAPAS